MVKRHLARKEGDKSRVVDYSQSEYLTTKSCNFLEISELCLDISYCVCTCMHVYICINISYHIYTRLVSTKVSPFTSDLKVFFCIEVWWIITIFAYIYNN